MFNYKYIFLSLLLSAFGWQASGQSSNFSQYHQSPVFNSPGDLAMSDYFQLQAHYRKQSLSGEQGFENMALSGIYPLYYGGGRKFGAIGLGILSETSGMLGILQEQSLRAGYAYNLQLSRRHHLSVGLQGGYYRRSIDQSKITTDGQYQNGVHVSGLPTGELLANGSSQAFKADAGFSWYVLDAYGEQRFSLGAAAFNMNKANYSYLSGSQEQAEPLRLLLHGSIRAISGERYALQPGFRYMHEQNYSQLNMGGLLLYGLQRGASLQERHIGFGAWYSAGNAAIVSLQLSQPSYVFSISYDLPAAAKVDYSQVNNAIEVSLGWRLNRGKKVKLRSPVAEQATEARAVEEQPEAVAVQQPAPVAEEAVVQEEEVKEQVVAAAEPQQEVKEEKTLAKELSAEEKEVLENNLSFEQVGSTTLSEGAKAELEKIAEVMQQNPELRLRILGHTCTLGTEQRNRELSLQRAETAKEALLAKGIAAQRIETAGRSSLDPIASNDTEAGRQKNRRVEFLIVE